MKRISDFLVIVFMDFHRWKPAGNSLFLVRFIGTYLQLFLQTTMDYDDKWSMYIGVERLERRHAEKITMCLSLFQVSFPDQRPRGLAAIQAEGRDLGICPWHRYSISASMAAVWMTVLFLWEHRRISESSNIDFYSSEWSSHTKL